MTAFNVVRFRVKPGSEAQFVEQHRKARPAFRGFLGGSLVKTGDQTFCFVGEWRNFQSIVNARPQMIAMLDGVRGMLEDLGSGLGVTDPISGQGLASTLRDVRLVRDALIEHQTWGTDIFRHYTDERNERVRRIMCVTKFMTTLFARFDPESRKTRAKAMERLSSQPELFGLGTASIAGPEAAPPEVFTDAYYDRIFAH